MKKYYLFSIFIGLSVLLLVISCNRNSGTNAFGGTCTETNICTTNSNKSHNTGKNCMDCHTSGGQGEGCFKAAGSVYQKSGNIIYKNAIVKLYTQPNGGGTLAATIYGDALGNFYTTEIINFSNGLYPSIIGTSGKSHYMSSSITTGACNSCHGVSTNSLYTE